ncbi:hypothetical protein ACH5RR_008603 [Cinchona calisaya]|uniref:Uncharacterized protein n=1 Tax=Cinchona calisaya TaxID=153742 RepID=A0ABD3ABY6_9GENT
MPRAPEATFDIGKAVTRSQAALNENSESDPDVALNWIAQMETKFKASRFLEDMEVQVVIPFLVGDTEN